MNTVVTSREEILKTSRELIQQQGWSAVSIRSVAAACGAGTAGGVNRRSAAGENILVSLSLLLEI